jgi:hypothetical protein
MNIGIVGGLPPMPPACLVDRYARCYSRARPNPSYLISPACGGCGAARGIGAPERHQ